MCEKEFKAIVLAAGIGSRMRDITNHKPKCLLPVGNLPVIWYPLSMLERAGFSGVVVVVLEEEQGEIKRTLDKLDLKLSFKYVSLKQEDDLSTADALRRVPHSHEDCRDVLVVSCDLVTSQPLDKFLNEFRRHEAGVSALFFPCVPDPTPGSLPGPKSKQKPERDLVGLDPASSRLVFLASASDFEDSLEVRMRVLRKHQKLELHSRLSDAHLYVITSSLWRYIRTGSDNCGMSLKGELIPYIVKQQMSSLNKEQRGHQPHHVSDKKREFFKHVPRDELQFQVQRLSTWSDYHGDVLRCFAFVSQETSVRVNTLATYCHVNRQILKPDIWNQLTGGKTMVKIHPTCNIKTRKIEGSLVGSGCHIDEGCKLERCCVGNNCTLGANVTMSDCVLMDNVTVESGATLVNCLVCERGVIEKAASLKSCLIGNNYHVAETSSHENEILSAVVMET